MATEKQIDANRTNSLTAGVKTEAGKQRSRFNSYKHGLAANVLISDFESIAESEENLNLVYESLSASLFPKNSLEEELVHKMALSIFKSSRCEILERNSFREEHNIFTHQVELESNEKLEVSLKYKGAIENSFYKALDTLIKLRQVHQLDLFWKTANE